MVKRLPPDVHAQCHKQSQLLHKSEKSLFTEYGARWHESVAREPAWRPLVNFPIGAVPQCLLYYFIFLDFHLMFYLYLFQNELQEKALKNNVKICRST